MYFVFRGTSVPSEGVEWGLMWQRRSLRVGGLVLEWEGEGEEGWWERRRSWRLVSRVIRGNLEGGAGWDCDWDGEGLAIVTWVDLA